MALRKHAFIHGIFIAYPVEHCLPMRHSIDSLLQLDESVPRMSSPLLCYDTHPIVQDRRGRPLRDLRISVTDRCNFRCVYCMPKQVFGKDFRFIPHSDMLSFEEISRLAHLFVSLGVEKIRLTGGEPLLRRHIERLIEQLVKLKTRDGRAVDVTLTTNGALLAEKAQTLFNAGLQRITISLDALDDAVFMKMNDVGFHVADVLRGIDVALSVGFSPIKINTVVQKGVNDNQVLPLARYFKNTPVIIRFIEYMDVGTTHDWTGQKMLPAETVFQIIDNEMPLEPLKPQYRGETAKRWRYCDGRGEIGIIASVTQPFCHDCTRLRLSTEGKLYPCLFATHGFDVRRMLREGCSDDAITTAITAYWHCRDNRYSELRGKSALLPINDKKIEMSYIGG